METTVAEILMLLGDKIVEIHNRDKTIKMLQTQYEILQSENIQLREDLGKYQKARIELATEEN